MAKSRRAWWTSAAWISTKICVKDKASGSRKNASLWSQKNGSRNRTLRHRKILGPATTPHGIIPRELATIADHRKGTTAEEIAAVTAVETEDVEAVGDVGDGVEAAA